MTSPLKQYIVDVERAFREELAREPEPHPLDRAIWRLPESRARHLNLGYFPPDHGTASVVRAPIKAYDASFCISPSAAKKGSQEGRCRAVEMAQRCKRLPYRLACEALASPERWNEARQNRIQQGTTNPGVSCSLVAVAILPSHPPLLFGLDKQPTLRFRAEDYAWRWTTAMRCAVAVAPDALAVRVDFDGEPDLEEAAEGLMRANHRLLTLGGEALDPTSLLLCSPCLSSPLRQLVSGAAVNKAHWYRSFERRGEVLPTAFLAQGAQACA